MNLELPQVTADDLRYAMGHFATGVTVVTSRDIDGQPVGTTANAVTSLSLDPPLVLVCFALDSATLEAIRRHGAFGVNVLGSRHRELSSAFARHRAQEVWQTVRHRVSRTSTPLLLDVIAQLDCTVERRVLVGDHEVVIGRVAEVEVTSSDMPPLVFYRGNYGGFAIPDE